MDESRKSARISQSFRNPSFGGGDVTDIQVSISAETIETDQPDVESPDELVSSQDIGEASDTGKSTDAGDDSTDFSTDTGDSTPAAPVTDASDGDDNQDTHNIRVQAAKDMLAALPSKLTLGERIAMSFVRYPRRHFFGYLLVMFAIVGIVFALDLFQISEMGAYDWSVPTGVASQSEDALASALDLAKASQPSDGGEVTSSLSRSEGAGKGIFQIMYDVEDGSSTVFTPARLQAMCEFEQLIMQQPTYAEFCLTDEPKGADTVCLVPEGSVVVLYYTQYNSSFDFSDCPELPVEYVDQMTDALLDSIYDGNSDISSFFSSTTKANNVSVSTRSFIQLGAPLDGFSSVNDRVAEQELKYQDFIKAFASSLFDKYDLSGTILRSAYRTPVTDQGMQIRVFSEQLFNSELNEQVNGDLILVVGSILFVAGWMYFHTGSGFITTVSMFAIVSSLVVAFFFYHFLFGVLYFTQLHILTIFLILGVGADDVFVFVDAWKQSKFAPYPALLAQSGRYDDIRAVDQTSEDAQEQVHHQKQMAFLVARLNVTYQHSASSVFNTSFTTAMAFFATAISPIMPVSSFGIYAANCIVINYLFVLTVIPATTLVDHFFMADRHCLNICTFGLLCRRHATKEASVRSESQHSNSNNDQVVATKDPEAGQVLELSQEQVLQDEAEAVGNRIERLFERIYVPTMLYSVNIAGHSCRIVSWAIVFASVGYIALSAFWASKLQSPVKVDENFSKDHMFTGFQDDFSLGFLGGTDAQFEKGTLTWGIAGVDRTGFNRYLPNENRGTVVFDDTFSVANPLVQEFFFQVCEDLEEVACFEKGCTGPDNKLVLRDSVRCFIRAFADTLEGGREGSLALGESDPEQFEEMLIEFARSNSSEAPAGRAKESWSELIGIVDDKVKFVTIKFTVTMPLLQPAGIVQPVDDLLDDFVRTSVDDYIGGVDASELDDGERKALESLGGYLKLIGLSSRWNDTQFYLVNGMLNGFAICFPVAFIVLLFATDNIVVAFYAILSIAGIVGCVMGFVQQGMGWYLGISEALVAVMIVGFSVDYVVHLGHTFMEAGSRTVGLTSRVDRFKYAARNMGPTVLAGAITTGGAGVFMFGCQLTFFAKMAVLITATVFFSTLLSHGFFMALCVVAGPEGNFGKVYIQSTLWKLTTCCKKKE